MTIVFDTMLFVYPSLELGAMSDESQRAFGLTDELIVPEPMFAELVECVRKWIVAGDLAPADLRPVLSEACSSVRRVVPTSTVAERALELALERRHDVYDALFVAVAERHSTRVVTYDRAMLRAFPEWSVSVPDFLARHG